MGRTAMALLAEAITGDGNDWRELPFKRDPTTLQPGDVIDIGALLDKARGVGESVQPAPPERQPGPGPQPTPEMMARAKEKGWEVEGSRAKALPGAKLWWLAWAITGSGGDHHKLPYTGRPEDLKAGDVIEIGPLLKVVKEREQRARNAARGLEQDVTEPLRKRNVVSPADTEKGEWIVGIVATREGLIGGKTATGHIIKKDDVFVALPSPSALHRIVVVSYKGTEIEAPVLDVGPHSEDDDYWNRENGRPRAESGQRTARLRERYGPAKNKAGIDLSDALWDRFGIDRKVGKVIVDWRFK
jgi:hypothetical protein